MLLRFDEDRAEVRFMDYGDKHAGPTNRLHTSAVSHSSIPRHDDDITHRVCRKIGLVRFVAKKSQQKYQFLHKIEPDHRSQWC